jgi:hypothetical protein
MTPFSFTDVTSVPARIISDRERFGLTTARTAVIQRRYRPRYRWAVQLSVILITAGKVAAGEGGTCTRRVRTYRPEHSMFAALDSSPRVRLGSGRSKYCRWTGSSVGP